MIKIKRQDKKSRRKNKRCKDGQRRRSRRGGGGGGVNATHNLALHPLSPPPVTRLKIKIKIKCDGGSGGGGVGAIAPRSVARGCRGDNWLNITPLHGRQRRRKGVFSRGRASLEPSVPR